MYSRDSDIFTSNKFTSHNSTSILKRIGTNSSIANPIGSFTDLIDEVSLAKNDISDSFVVFEKNSGDSKSNSKFSTKTGISIDSDTEKTTGLNYKTSKSLHQSVKKKFDRSVSLESNDSSKVYLYIQMQLCQRHSLRDWLTTNTKRNYTQVLSIFEQILQAVEHVHLHGLIHRDLKVKSWKEEC